MKTTLLTLTALSAPAFAQGATQAPAGDYVLDDADDPFDHTFEKDALTSDESRYEQWRQQLDACPHLAVGGPTWGWLAFALDAGERSLKPMITLALESAVRMK